MGEKRRDPRHAVVVGACIRNGTGAPRTVAVTDLSRRGCRIRVPGSGFGIDAFVTITVAGLGFLGARVKWRKADLHGICFEEPLHPAVLDHIRHVLGLPPSRGGEVEITQQAR